MRRVSTSEARRRLSNGVTLMTLVTQRVLIGRRGKELAALIPIADLRLLERLADDLEDRLDAEDALRVEADASDPSLPWELKGELPLRKRRSEETDLRRRAEGGQRHVPVGGRAQGQAPLLRAPGAGQDVLQVGGRTAVLRVDEVRHHLAASGGRGAWLAAGYDGCHDQFAGGDRRRRTHGGVGSHALRYHHLVERARRGNKLIVRDRPLQIGGSRRRQRDREAKWRGRGMLPVEQCDVARSAERRRARARPWAIDRNRDRLRPGAIDVVRDLHLARRVVLAEPPDQQVAAQNGLIQSERV